MTVGNDPETLRQALRQMPVPEPSPGFVDRVLARATAAAATAAGNAARAGWLRHLATRWETWVGAALGGAVAAAVALILLWPSDRADRNSPPIALALHEARDIEVLIDSERALRGAKIRVAVSGGVALNGFENEREIDWQTSLEPGNNLLSLPIVARTPGAGRVVAIIEHEGRSRRVVVNLTVQPAEA